MMACLYLHSPGVKFLEEFYFFATLALEIRFPWAFFWTLLRGVDWAEAAKAGRSLAQSWLPNAGKILQPWSFEHSRRPGHGRPRRR